jgi:hypothetical protein
MAMERTVTRIVVPTTNLDCPAVNALSREGILFDAVLMEDDLHYSRLWTELWLGKETFINIEHDVAPWPGAIYAFMDCPGHWCSFMYPAAPHSLIDALGCVRINESIIERYPDLHTKWEGVAWNRMDGVVMSNLLKLGYQSHVHTPPVAHVKK